MRNFLLTIEYDGSGFSGWQRQPGVRTVQGTLEAALSRICASEIRVDGTSRTDAGVHAFGQRATFSGSFGIPGDRIKKAANDLLAGGRSGPGGDVRISAVEEVPPGFHARFRARGKTYLYKIRNCFERNVFERNYFYQISRPLDLDAMRRAAAPLCGTHDFKCFQASGGKELLSTVRTVSGLRIREELLDEKLNPAGFQDRILTLEVTGDGFLYNMVRILTGTLIDVGMGKIPPEETEAILESRSRARAGHTAPPQGLYLAEVYF